MTGRMTGRLRERMAGVQRLQALSGRDESVAALGLIAACCGALAAIPVHTPLRGALLLPFLLVGPGAAVMCRIDMPTAPTVAAIIGVSISAVTAVAVAMAWLRVWQPVAACLLLAAAIAGSCLFRLRGALAADGPAW